MHLKQQVVVDFQASSMTSRVVCVVFERLEWPVFRLDQFCFAWPGETYLESLNNLPERYRNEKDLALYLARIAPPASDGVTALTAADLVISCMPKIDSIYQWTRS
eukprot:GHVT01073970.1.p1 GENE.GHVT01073970.1~~GHVT01073970.1.p1  ORF type:complete len:105 (+),score=4.18 GHVT01073970.1:173-487(+)